MDGVYLSESGIRLIKEQTIEQPKRQRVRRPRQPSGGQPAAPQGSTTTPPQSSSLSTGLFGFRGRLSTEDSEDGSKDLMDVDVEPKMEVDEETKLTSEEVAKQDAESELKKKRQRKLQKLGIGGFVAKARSRSVSAKEQDVTLPLAGAGETSSEAALAALSGDVAAPAPEPAAEATGTTAEKPKRRRRVKKKNPLEDSFPLYLQEAFFGQSLLAASKTEQAPDMPSEDDEDSAMGRSEDNSIVVLETSQDKSEDARVRSDSGAPSPALHTAGGSKGESPALHDDGTCTPIKTGSDDEDLGLKDILPHDLPQDDELMDMLMNEGDDLSKQGSGLDDVTLNEHSGAGVSEEEGSAGVKDNDPLSGNIDTVLLSPHFNLVDSMVSAGSGLPHMDSKDVEDVFKGVLSPGDSCGPPESVGSMAPTVWAHPSACPPRHLFPWSTAVPSYLNHPPSPWMDPDADLPSTGGHKNILKWESDEALGAGATISPVLYANLNYQNLRMEYPSWPERSKQIAKIWRNLPPEKRQPYLQKARENRAASRIQKSQACIVCFFASSFFFFLFLLRRSAEVGKH
ncbi:hypothetical protein MTO96_006978 [Rhipicephalus appendiculatus]